MSLPPNPSPCNYTKWRTAETSAAKWRQLHDLEVQTHAATHKSLRTRLAPTKGPWPQGAKP